MFWVGYAKYAILNPMNNYEQKFLEKYNILNPEQKEAVDTIDGPVFVMAGPGTGKTQILTLRIANILRKAEGIEPENILALTFTNAAAYNMRERLAQMIGGELAYRVRIATFHSFAEETIKEFPEYFPHFFRASLISPIAQIELIESIVNQKNDLVHFSKFKRRDTTLKNIAFAIGKIKDEGLTPDAFRERIYEKYNEDLQSPELLYKRKTGKYQKGDMNPLKLEKLNRWRDKSLELADIYETYQEALAQHKQYDFSDLILAFVQELHADSQFQLEMQEQYQYLLVDEHQDTNDAQNRIIHALIDNPVWEGKPNIFVVGDPKQAIFRFAGASEQAYTALLEKVSEVKVITLEHNYRSHQNILDRSHQLIAQSPQHANEQKLKAFFEGEGRVEYRQFQNDKMELLFIVQDIQQKIEAGKDPNEIAILYRNNKDGEDIAMLLSAYGIPVQDFSKKNILKDRDMLKLFFLFRSVYDLSDDEALAKSLFIDFLNFDVYEVQKILKHAQQAKRADRKGIYALLRDEKRLREIGISEEHIPHYLAYADFLARAKSSSENEDFLHFFSWFIRESGFLKYVLAQADARMGIAKIEKLFDEVRKESLARNTFSFHDFVEYLNTLKKHHIAMNITNTLSDGVQLMTFHGSKGLEFETVYIMKALQKKKQGSEITLPFEDFESGSIEDERRLFYVAMTRAKHECFISSHIMGADGKEKNPLFLIHDIEGLEAVDVRDWEKEHQEDVVHFFDESQTHIRSLVDQEYIEQLFKSKQLSVSALNNYLESPLKYFFRNLVALPEARSHFLDFGNLIHESLEAYFNQCKQEQRILGEGALQEAFQQVLQSKFYYAEFEERAWNILSNYFQHYQHDFALPVENELKIRGIPFSIREGEELLLSGAIDKITKNEDGSLTVWDYKTGKAYSDMDKKRREKIKRQAVFYKLLLQDAYGGRYRFRHATFDFLEKNSKGEYEQKSFEIDQADVDTLREEIMQLVQDIQEGTLLGKDFAKDSTNVELLEFLEVMRGPIEQKKLFE